MRTIQVLPLRDEPRIQASLRSSVPIENSGTVRPSAISALQVSGARSARA